MVCASTARAMPMFIVRTARTVAFILFPVKAARISTRLRNRDPSGVERHLYRVRVGNRKRSLNGEVTLVLRSIAPAKYQKQRVLLLAALRMFLELLAHLGQVEDACDFHASHKR